MKYGNKLYKRRRPRRRPLRANKSTKLVTKVVKRELHRNIENKFAMAYQNNFRVNTNMGGVTASDLYAVIPSLAVGGEGQTGERIGNKIKPLSLVLNCSFTPNQTTPETSWGDYGAYFDLYVFSVKGRQRLENDISSTVATMFRPSIYGSSVDTLYQGLPQDWFKSINDDNVICHYRKRFFMSNPYNTGNNINSASNGGTLFKNHTISLSKKLKASLQYTNANDGEPNNQAIYATMVCTKPDNVIDTTNYTLGTVNWSSKLIYEDA